ncbi:MAG: hypothetical protein QME49_06385 [bacterium]|nr:hypothetical protein [bacterium]
MKKILLLISILLFPAYLYAANNSNSFNISGIKMFSSVYTDFTGDAPDKSKGFKLNQSTKLLLEGKTGEGLNAYMNYDDTREINPLEMLVNYQRDIFSSSLGHMDIVLNETEFAGYNCRMFGVKSGIKTDKFNTQIFAATNRGISKTAVYKGDIGHNSQYFSQDGEMRKYYLLLPEETVNEVLVDDGIMENGDGFTSLTPNTDYTILTQSCGSPSTTIRVLVLTIPAEIDAIIQVAYDQSGTLTIKGPDTADEEIHSYYRLSYHDVIEGTEVIVSGSSTLTKGIDYQINYSDGSIYFTATTSFNIDYDYAAKTYRLDPPVLPGSERVMVNGIRKQRELDYTINYETGEVRFFDQHMSGIYADSEVKIEYETVAEGNRYNLAGMRSGYSLNKGMDVGCTYLFKSDAAPKAKTTQSMTQMKQQIFGFDINIHPGERLKITGELAASTKEPGNDAKAYLDDMEGDGLLTRWKALSSGVNISAEKNPENVLHPEGVDNHQVLRIMCGTGTNTIEQIFATPLDLSLYSTIDYWVRAQGLATVTLRLYSATTPYFAYNFSPDKIGEYISIKKSLSSDAIICGEPDLKTINRIQFIFNNTGSETVTLYMDDLVSKEGSSMDGLAKKIEAEFSTEKLKLKAGVKDVDSGFNPIGLSGFESISDTRQGQAEAQVFLIPSTMFFLKYENNLKSKSSLEKQIKKNISSTGIKFEPSDVFKLNIDYKQEDENDSKEIRLIDNVNKKTTLSLDAAKENILHLVRLRFFNRLMNINAWDNVHNFHTSSNHTYLRFNLEPVSGIELIPEYKLKTSKDINKDSRISKEENILGAINVTSSDKLSSIIRYSHNNLSNLVLNSEQNNQTFSMELGITPKNRPSLNTFLENTQKKQMEHQSITSQTDASGGDMKLTSSLSEKWKWLSQYRFSRSNADGIKNKTDNYTGEITRWFKMWKQAGTAGTARIAGTSSLTSRIRQDITNSITTDIYLLIWETIFKKGLATKLSYECTKKDTLSKDIPSIKVGYTTTKWNVSSEFKQTSSLNKVSNLKTIDYFSSMGAGYTIKDKLTINEMLTCTDNDSTHQTGYSSSTTIKWWMLKMMNIALSHVWSDVHNHLDATHNYTSHKVNMDVSIVF